MRRSRVPETSLPKLSRSTKEIPSASVHALFCTASFAVDELFDLYWWRLCHVMPEFVNCISPVLRPVTLFSVSEYLHKSFYEGEP